MTREEQEQIILENIPEVYEAGRGSIKNEVANALKGSASGEVVGLKDVSPVGHNMGVRVSSKNLISSDIWDDLFDKQEDGSYLSNKKIQLDVSLRQFYLPPAVYTISYDVKCEIGKNYRIRLIYEDDSYIDNYMSATGDYVHYENVTAEKAIKAIQWNYADLSQNVYFKNLQIELGTTATAYTSFVPDVGAVKLKAMGKNLCDKSVISLSGDIPFDQTVIDCYLSKYPFFRHGTYTMSADVTVYPEDTAEYRYFDVSVIYADGRNELKRVGVASPTSTPAANLRDGKTRRYSITFDTDINKELLGFRLRPLSASIVTGRYCKAENIQLEFETETEYEPYIEPVEYAVSADGTVEGVKSIYPSTTLTTDTVGALIEVDYNRDINKAFEELRKVILSLGGIL